MRHCSAPMQRNAARENDVHRRELLLASIIATAALAAGCISVDVGGPGTGATMQYRIADQVAAPAPAAKRLDRALLISPTSNGSVDDSLSLAFARTAQGRAAYQFATWSDRPSQQLSMLLIDRVAARQSFEFVSMLGSGVGAEMQVNLTVVDFYHDAQTAPGVAWARITVELVDRTTREQLGRRTFAASAPVATASGAGAAAALSVASTAVIDQIVPWLESTAAELPPLENPPARRPR